MDIREKFLNYFKNKGHTIKESSPLIPIDDDGTLMFVNAGMVPFKSIFTGDAPIPNPPRMTSSQTCLRAGGKHNDLDNVGYTARHHTLFEMLGNFSFGDYFKKDAMAYAWEFVTSKEYLNLPIDRLWVTIHKDDDEAYELWQEHISKDRIVRFGDADNFWSMGDTGACGPCSEIFYDQGEEYFNSSEDVMGGDGDRFLEIWNLVFMQYEKDKDGNLIPLPKPSIDTGMGLERVVAIKEGVTNNYHSSLFMPFINKIGEMIGVPYDHKASNSASYRVIADHLRSCSFLLAQGVNFDKEGRGYVLRRIMRRAIRHGYLLGFREPFIYKLVDTLVEVMGKQYDYLLEKVKTIKASMRLEEERFFRTIEDGIKLFNEELKKTKDSFDGEVAFKLYDTYGFPLDLTEDMLREKNITLDIEGFNRKMEIQKAQSKANWKGTGDAMQSGDFKVIKENFGVNKFVGYEERTAETVIVALLDNNFRQTDRIDNEGWIYLKETPFYAESGGQVGDCGVLIVDNNSPVIEVLDTKKFLDMNLSKIRGSVEVDRKVKAVVNHKRKEIEKHHSATHLLHSGLRAVLGEHISQAGSLNDDKRLRFDFSHPKAMSDREIIEVERWVNDRIGKNIKKTTKIVPVEDAKKEGAIALFGEKYGDEVRVVKFGKDSIELCGGTHVESTSEIGLFMIVKESGVSAGVRRIEAICGDSAIRRVAELREELNDIKKLLKNQNPTVGINRLKEEIKTLKEELRVALQSNKRELTIITIDKTTVIIDEIVAGDIKKLIDDAKNRYSSLAIMLFQKKNNRVLMACGTKNVPIKAGAWIKEIAPLVGGGGGGRDDFAQAGGKDISKIDKAKNISLKYVRSNLKNYETTR